MASGDTLCIFRASDNVPPTTNYATLDTRNNHLVLDFDGTTNESAVFSGKIPQAYADGGYTAYLHYSMETATTNDTDWDVSVERIGDSVLDVDADSFDTVNSVDGTTVPGTSGHVDVISVALTNSDSLAVGEQFRLKVTRDAASDADNTDAELHMVEIRET